MKIMLNTMVIMFTSLVSWSINAIANNNVMNIHLPQHDPNGEFVVSSGLIVFSILLFLIAATIAVYYGLKAQKNKRFGGNHILLSSIGVAVTDIAPGQKGKVKIHGEIWNAVSNQAIRMGEEVTVIEINLLVLRVDRAATK